jgi:radical SAM-linked protein
VQRVQVRYAKRGRLRFSSHRDLARAFERALRRAEVPMAYSAGFTPHPKISYVGAAPTGVASEAEYLELGLARQVDVDALRVAIDGVLPAGLDVLTVVPAGPGSLAERMEASHWRVELPGVDAAELTVAVTAFLDQHELGIERSTKQGRRTVDARGPVVRATVARGGPGDGHERAILDLVVRQATPAVRPDDVLAALRAVAGLAPQVPPVAVRVAQGPLDSTGEVGDPLAVHRTRAEPPPP